MLFGSGLAILVGVFAEQKRGMAMGLYSGSVYFSLTVSPFLGGWFTETFGWRSVFWINIPLSFAVLCLVFFRMPGEWKKHEKEPFDWTGSLIFAGWAATFVYGVSGLPEMSSILTLLISTCYLILFFWHQSRVKNPLISMRFFTRNRVFAFSLAASILMYSVNFPMSFLLSIFLQLAKGLTPTEAGAVLLVQAFTMALVAPISGRISDRIEPRIVATFGSLCCVLGFVIIWLLSTSSVAWLIGLGLVSVGFGFGFFSTPNNSAAMGAVSKEDLGTAAAAVNLARNLGNLFGMSTMAMVIYALIGPREFSPELNNELMTAVHISMLIARCLGAFGDV